MSKKPMQRFEEDWRQWADRPAELSPKVAAQRIAARLEPRRRSTPWLAWRPLLASAAVAGLAVVGIWQGRSWLPGDDGPSTDGLPVADSMPSLTTPSANVLVIQLDSETPLYLTLAAHHEPPGSDSETGDLL